MIGCPNSRVAAPGAALGLVAMMLQCVIVKCVAQGCSEQIALEGQDLSRTYLAHHELETY